jgi:hypothetical protein
MSRHLAGSVSSTSGLELGSPNHRTVSAPLGIYTYMALPIHRACRGSQDTNRSADGFFEESLGRAVINTGLAIESCPSQRRAGRITLLRPRGCESWLAATAECRLVLDGWGNVDEVKAPEVGLIGMTLPVRLRAARVVALLSKQPRRHRAAAGHRSLQGRPRRVLRERCLRGVSIRVSYIWLELNPTSARWEQAFSTDHGKQIRVMSFVRA